MKTIVALFATLVSLSAFASGDHRPTPPPQPLIVGEWTSDQPIYSGQVWIWTHFNFSARELTMHATCEFHPNLSLTVGVNSQVAYNGNLIYIYERNEASVNDGYRYCNAALAPSTWEFYFTNGDTNHAVLFAPVPWQMRFNVSRVMPEDLK